MRVADASVVAALVFAEPRRAEASELLAGGEIAAPELLSYELASVCSKKMRTHPGEADLLLAGFRLFRGLSIALHPVDHVAVIELAREWRLTSDDASYLWLAKELGGEILTFDRGLARAARGSAR